MPTDDDREQDEVIEDEEEVVEPAPAPVAQSSINTRELQDSIRTGIVEAFGAVRGTPQQAPNPDEQEVAIDEDDDVATQIRKSVHNATIPLKRQVKNLESFGLNKIGELTANEAARNLPHYNRYRGEIEAKLKTLDPATRANSEAIKYIYDSVVASHVTELIEEGIQASKKRDLQGGNLPKPGSGSSRVVGGRPKPDEEERELEPEDMFDEEQLSLIEERGGKDSFARRISQGRFSNWSDYAKSAKSMRAAPRKEGRRVIRFKKITDKPEVQPK